MNASLLQKSSSTLKSSPANTPLHSKSSSILLFSNLQLIAVVSSILTLFFPVVPPSSSTLASVLRRRSEQLSTTVSRSMRSVLVLSLLPLMLRSLLMHSSEMLSKGRREYRSTQNHPSSKTWFALRLSMMNTVLLFAVSLPLSRPSVKDNTSHRCLELSHTHISNVPSGCSCLVNC